MLEIFANPVVLETVEQVLFNNCKFDIVGFEDDYFLYDTGNGVERFHYSDLFYVLDLFNIYVETVFMGEWFCRIIVEKVVYEQTMGCKTRQQAEKQAIKNAVKFIQ